MKELVTFGSSYLVPSVPGTTPPNVEEYGEDHRKCHQHPREDLL